MQSMEEKCSRLWQLMKPHPLEIGVGACLVALIAMMRYLGNGPRSYSASLAMHVLIIGAAAFMLANLYRMLRQRYRVQIRFSLRALFVLVTVAAVAGAFHSPNSGEVPRGQNRT